MAAEKCTLIPEQLFESQEAFIVHVKRFAVENGFNVRLDDVERDKEGLIRKRDIVCSSEGAPRGKDAAKREGSADPSEPDADATTPRSAVAHSGAHRRKSMKTGCRWLARASRQPSGMWKIIMLRLEHNHELTTRYELPMPLAHTIRTGDNDSISAAALAARNAMEAGGYAGPSDEFKNLFLQMSVACNELCWAAARHPATVAEVLSEIRRLQAHLNKQNAAADATGAHASRARSGLPTIAEGDDANEDEDNAMDTGDSPDGVAAAQAATAQAASGSLVMMSHSNGMMVGGHMPGNSPSQHTHPSQQQQQQQQHFIGVPHLISSQMDVTMTESAAQILARSQNRNVEPQSPELNGSNGPQPTLSAAMAAAVATANNSADTPISPTSASSAGTGPVKRSRGRPRKNPMAADSAKTTKSKAQQKREQLQRESQQQQQQQQPREQPIKPTPTPADLASLSHKIISQNAASSPANMQRPLSSALALPSQSLQVQSHAHGRAQLLGSNANVSSLLDSRSHINQVQRQPQQTQQSQQSPTFFLGAAEGNGYSKHPAAAAAAVSATAAANVEYSANSRPAVAADSYSDVSEALGYGGSTAAAAAVNSEPSAATAAATAAVPQYSSAAVAASAPANASSAAHILRRGGLPSPATAVAGAAAVPPAAAAADPAVPRSAAISAISDSSANAPAAVNSSEIDAATAAAVAAFNPPGAFASGRPRLPNSAAAATATTAASAMRAGSGNILVDREYSQAASLSSAYQQPVRRIEHPYQQQQQQQQRPDSAVAYRQPEQASSAANMVNQAAASPAVGTISHLVLNNNQTGTQRTHLHHPHYQQQQQQQQQQHMFHVNPPMHATHLGRNDDPTSAAQFNSYLIMSRAQQQQQQQQQQQHYQQQHHAVQHHPAQQQAAQPSEHLVGVTHQSPPVSAMALPPMTHGNSVLSTTRRLDELHLNQYHTTMNAWQM